MLLLLSSSSSSQWFYVKLLKEILITLNTKKITFIGVCDALAMLYNRCQRVYAFYTIYRYMDNFWDHLVDRIW